MPRYSIHFLLQEKENVEEAEALSSGRTHTRTNAHTHIYTCTHAHTYMLAHARTHAHVHTQLHTHTPLVTHALKHTQVGCVKAGAFSGCSPLA
jgi:hypothetical protein